MSGKNQQTAFKERTGATEVFIGGTVDPETIKIVGLDIKIEEWNEDLWDEARLSMAVSHPLDPIKTLEMIRLGGTIPTVSVTERRGIVMAVTGRRRILVARAANKLMLERQESTRTLIRIPIQLDKGAALHVSVRIENEGRLEDPPFVKAANAANLRSRGLSDLEIGTIFSVTGNTIVTWRYYSENCDPSIKSLIEDHSKSKDERIPFLVGAELARWSGPREFAHQRAALKYLLDSKAKLTSAEGIANAKNVIKAIVSGQTPLTAPEAVPGAPPSAPESSPESSPDQEHDPKPSRQRPEVTRSAPRITLPALRLIATHLEPTIHDPHQTEADRVAHAVMVALVSGDTEMLSAWPRVADRVRKVIRSPIQALPKTETDAVYTKPCPRRACDRGIYQGKTCGKCEGRGKIK